MHTIQIDLKDYKISQTHLLNLAAEFYGYRLEAEPAGAPAKDSAGEATTIELGFDDHDGTAGETLAKAFLATLNGAFKPQP